MIKARHSLINQQLIKGRGANFLSPRSTIFSISFQSLLCIKIRHQNFLIFPQYSLFKQLFEFRYLWLYRRPYWIYAKKRLMKILKIEGEVGIFTFQELKKKQNTQNLWKKKLKNILTHKNELFKFTIIKSLCFECKFH